MNEENVIRVLFPFKSDCVGLNGTEHTERNIVCVVVLASAGRQAGSVGRYQANCVAVAVAYIANERWMYYNGRTAEARSFGATHARAITPRERWRVWHTTTRPTTIAGGETTHSITSVRLG